MALFDDKVKDQLKGILTQMSGNVELLYFTQEIECATCKDGGSFVGEISSLSDKIKFTTYNLIADKEKSEKYGIDKVPAIVVLDNDSNDTGIRFYGIPGGYEINSFLSSLLEVSGKKEDIPEDILKRIQAIDKEVHIQVFVSLGCPYCPDAVSTAHRLALENNKIKADMIESATFPHMAIKYNVSGVPKIIINEEHDLTGAQPITAFLDVIEHL